MNRKKALIFGITGQDGSYLTKLLLEKGYKVFGVSRSLNKKNDNFKKLNININELKIFRVQKPNLTIISKIIKQSKCEKIFFLSGITSVNYSYLNPLKTIDLNTKYIFYILEACRKLNNKIKIYNSLSSECFGAQNKISENKIFNPQSPYGLSKSISFFIIKYYRETFNLWISNGILFNHESSLRPEKFVIKRIVNQVKKIKKTNLNKIIIGNSNVIRDWGWAPEFVNFIYKISNLKKADDFIIATGKTYNLKKLIKLFLKKINIKKKIYIIENKKFKRKNDIKYNSANINKLFSTFKSKPMIDGLKVITKIYNKELL
tara:strand:- start:1755 stop:2708 length:954 start_codon:yes stop_codon:yes gene_type:complete